MADPSDDSLRIQKAYAGPGVVSRWISAVRFSAVRFLAAAAAGVGRAAGEDFMYGVDDPDVVQIGSPENYHATDSD